MVSFLGMFPAGCSKAGKGPELLGVKPVGRLKGRCGKIRGGRFGLKFRDSVLSIVKVDLDRDGKADMVVAGRWFLRFFRNSGGKFEEKAHWDWSVCCWHVELKAGDLDGDGDIDLVVGSFLGMEEKTIRRLGFHPPGDVVWINPLKEKGQSGAFSGTIYSLDSSGSSTRDLELGDVDGDGDLDLVELKRKRDGYEVSILFNDGNGRFYRKNRRLKLEKKEINRIELGDADNDGDLDLFLGVDGPNLLFLNMGDGRFLPAEREKWRSGGENTMSLALGDIDGDGSLDIVEGNGFPAGANRIYLFRRGRFLPFTSRIEYPVMDDTSYILLENLDGKNGLDIVVLNRQKPRNYISDSKVLFNDGGGFFLNSVKIQVSESPNCGAVFDVDGDGVLDLVVGGDDGLQVFLGKAGEEFQRVW